MSKFKSAECSIYTRTLCSPHLIFPLWPQWIVLTSQPLEFWTVKEPIIALPSALSIHTLFLLRKITYLLLLPFDRSELFWPATSGIMKTEGINHCSTMCNVHQSDYMVDIRKYVEDMKIESCALIFELFLLLCIGIKVQLAMREPFSPSKVSFWHSRAMHCRLHLATSFDFSHATIIYRLLCQLQP